MSALIVPFPLNEELSNKLVKTHEHTRNNKTHKNDFKSKGRSKCCKCYRKLKCKLCKYKLRRNGEEDQDVIDVSHIFLSSLQIKSPNILDNPEEAVESEFLRPKNYLFKMTRQKQKAKSKSSEEPVKESNDIGSSSLSQDKKHTNAFKLLMDSRNKSIGSNSPGKERIDSPSESQVMAEKKNAKVKRNLALQKLADAKGALKKKELDTIQELHIQQKMDKRAKRLKKMLLNAKPKDAMTSTVCQKIQKVDKVLNIVDDSSNSDDDIIINGKLKVTKTTTVTKKPEKMLNETLTIVDDSSNSNDAVNEIHKMNKSKALKLIDIFEAVKPTHNINLEKKCIPKEDKEFLSKLSPSIRKKENMLSYFKKIEKISSDEKKSPDNIESKIKVKISHKKKIKKKRLSLNKTTTTNVLLSAENHNENNTCLSETITDSLDYEFIENKDRKKRKRKESSTDLEVKQDIEAIQSKESTDIDKKRPKRNVKKPLKYNDDVQFSSSDEELNKFTPKKRKQFKITTKLTEVPDQVIILDEEIQRKISKPKQTGEQEIDIPQNKPKKLAPIFVPKPLVNPEQAEAKQKFLYSGVPEQIKKIIANEKNLSTTVTNEFPVVVHVQQNVESSVQNTIKKNNYFIKEYTTDEETNPCNTKDLFQIPKVVKRTNVFLIPPPKTNVNTILHTIKELYPKFPAYRTYRLLKDKSKGELKECNITNPENSIEVLDDISDLTVDNPYCLNWTSKYKATSTQHVLGNFESIKELKKWLQSWVENDTRAKNTPSSDSDSSDFCYDTDSNSKDSMKSLKNLLILNGPVGSGKTSSVYTVASELAMKVIEVNTSSKRTGKMMLQDLQEATQSHKVNRRCADNLANPVGKAIRKRGRPKKTTEVSLKKCNSREETFSQQSISQESRRTGMSLILVDDADIVFDQDDGFSSAIAQLAQCSKRPVILVTSTLSCPHLQRFIQSGRIVNLQPLPPRILGTWLDIVCLADSGACWPGLGAKILDYFKGDIRKSINCLQFYLTSYKENQDNPTSENRDRNLTPEDEGSNLSWVENESSRHSNQCALEDKDVIWTSFLNSQSNLLNQRYPLDLVNVWCSVPRLLNFEYSPLPDTPDSIDTECKEQRILELQSISNVMDILSDADYNTCNYRDVKCNILSQPWYSAESDSVSEIESYASYTKVDDTTSDIFQELVTGSMLVAQKILQCERNTAVTFPSMVTQRQKDRLISRHNKLTDNMSQSAILDRKALALDYWSTCRTICRIEKSRTDVVSKRNNRFCHYLKSLNVMGGSSMFDGLANSLSCKGKND